MEANEITIQMERVSGMEFRVTFGEGLDDLIVDEPAPVGSGKGPNPSRLVATAVANCLTASLLFCLGKARLEAGSARADARLSLERNEAGRLRIGGVRVRITVGLDEADRGRAGRCLDLFEDFCVVTQSLRDGIDVQVEVVDESGAILAG